MIVKLAILNIQIYGGAVYDTLLFKQDTSSDTLNKEAYEYYNKQFKKVKWGIFCSMIAGLKPIVGFHPISTTRII